MAGSSNFTSWVRTATASARPEADLRRRPRPASRRRAGRHRESGPAWRTRPARRSRSCRSPARARSGRDGGRLRRRRPRPVVAGPGRPPGRLAAEPIATVPDSPRSRATRAAARSAASSAGEPSEPVSEPSAPISTAAGSASPSPGATGPNSAVGESAGSGIATHSPAVRAAASTSGRRRGSTSTSIVPPQARPTSQACSSLIP